MSLARSNAAAPKPIANFKAREARKNRRKEQERQRRQEEYNRQVLAEVAQLFGLPRPAQPLVSQKSHWWDHIRFWA